MSKNEVTGDLIYTKQSRSYENNYDRIFRRKANTCCYCDEEIHPEELVKVKGESWHRDCLNYVGEE